MDKGWDEEAEKPRRPGAKRLIHEWLAANTRIALAGFVLKFVDGRFRRLAASLRRASCRKPAPALQWRHQECPAPVAAIAFGETCGGAGPASVQ